MCKGWMWLGLFVICIPFTLQAESGTWQQLFNGKDLTGWKHVGPGSHMVEDGLIKSKGGMGLLYWTGGKLGNCTIRVVFQMRDDNSNSGVFIRIPIEPREEWMPVHYGYEVQIDNEPEKSNEDDYHITGALYSLTKPLAKTGSPARVEHHGDYARWPAHRGCPQRRQSDRLHGRRSGARAKFDFEPQRGRRPLEGYIGLQNHSDSDVVFFKEVAIKKLKK